MTNVTVTVDENVLRQARIRALEDGTSLNAVVAAYLEEYAGWRARHAAAVERLLLVTGQSTPEEDESARARGGRTWRREDLHDR